MREGGEIVERIPVEKDLFATMLGGPDGQTLFLMLAEWDSVENTATGTLKDVKDRQVFMKKIGKRWYLENKEKAEAK